MCSSFLIPRPRFRYSLPPPFPRSASRAFGKTEFNFYEILESSRSQIAFISRVIRCSPLSLHTPRNGLGLSRTKNDKISLSPRHTPPPAPVTSPCAIPTSFERPTLATRIIYVCRKYISPFQDRDSSPPPAVLATMTSATRARWIYLYAHLRLHYRHLRPIVRVHVSIPEIKLRTKCSINRSRVRMMFLCHRRDFVYSSSYI